MQIPDEINSVASKWRIASLLVFGSMARGDAHANSDIDLLVEFQPGQSPSLLGHIQLQDELSRIFGRKVDLSTTGSISNSRNIARRKQIFSEAEEIFCG